MLNEISIDITKPISNTSPLRYPGGKTRACKKLDEILNQYFKKEIKNKSNKSFDTIVSPFFGGGSFEFHLQNNYNLNIIANDKFTPLYNFWNICKNNDKNENNNGKDQLCKALYNDVISGISKEKFLEYRKNVLIETDKIKQAEQYFIINRCSFSGATLSGGFSEEASKKRFTKSSVDRIKALDLSKFQIHNKDFEDFIIETYQTSNLQTHTNTKNNNNHTNLLLFLDPPYYLEKNSKLYGNNGDMHENFEHKKLFDLLSKEENKNIKFMMTYNNCDYIKDLYSQNKNCKILDVNWSYGMNKSKESSEIVIIRN